MMKTWRFRWSRTVFSMRKQWPKVIITPWLLLVFILVPGSKALAQFPNIDFRVTAPYYAQAGETYQVTVYYTNNTGATIEDVVISTEYPAGLSFSYSPAGEEPDGGTDNTWTIGDVADAVSGNFRAFLTVADDVASSTQLANLFSLAYEVGGVAQTSLEAGDITRVKETTLQVWNFNPLGAEPGSQAMYRIVYRNYSNMDAANVVFTYWNDYVDPAAEGYPAGFTFSSSSIAPTTGDHTWSIGNVNADDYGYIWVSLDVDAGITEDTYTSRLEVTYDDTISKNNEAQTSTDANTVTVSHTPVASVSGVWLAADVENLGVNYYPGGGFDPDTGVLTLGVALPSATEPVLVDYTYTKPYTQTLTDSTRVADDLYVLVANELEGDDIGQQPWSPDSEWIVFMATFPGGTYINNDIFKVRKDGTELTQLTTYEYCDNMPGWSPLGDQIAYSRRNRGTMPDPFDPSDSSNADIYVMDVDGSNNTQLTTKGDCQHWVVWSPDGSKIAYKDDMGTVNIWQPALWVMDADGGNQTALFVPGEAGSGGKPWQFWSPDSEWLGFSSTAHAEDWYTDLYKISADGTGLTRLTWTPESCDQFCGFSADGETILSWNEYDAILYTMDKDGLLGRPILQTEHMFNWVHGQKAKWSPPAASGKSRWVVVPIEQDGTGDNQIWLVSWDGTYLKQLTSEGDMNSPVMSPDGSAIVAVEMDNLELYVMNLGTTDTDGEGLRDWEELITGTDASVADSDGGGESDASEVDNGRNPLDAADDVTAAAPPGEDDDGICFISTVL
jgi:Tol biopolymer transport system component